MNKFMKLLMALAFGAQVGATLGMSHEELERSRMAELRAYMVPEVSYARESEGLQEGLFIGEKELSPGMKLLVNFPEIRLKFTFDYDPFELQEDSLDQMEARFHESLTNNRIDFRDFLELAPIYTLQELDEAYLAESNRIKKSSNDQSIKDAALKWLNMAKVKAEAFLNRRK